MCHMSLLLFVNIYIVIIKTIRITTPKFDKEQLFKACLGEKSVLRGMTIYINIKLFPI